MKFEYLNTTVRDLRANTRFDEDGKLKIDTVTLDGRSLNTTKRFWTSLQARFGFSKNIFKYFTPEETFNRISERSPNDRIRVTVETNSENGRSNLLAATSPAKPLVKFDDLMNLLDKQDMDTSAVDFGGFRGRRIHGHDVVGQIALPGIDHTPTEDNPTGQWRPALVGVPQIAYSDGIIRSIHTPAGQRDFAINGDAFSNKFVMDTPIDGYGNPSLYLMLLRLVCTNGAIAFSPAFRSELGLGKNEDSFDYAMGRCFEGFNNEEGYRALQNRYEVAAKSWASINEINRVYETLVRLHSNGLVLNQKYQDAINAAGGDGSALMDASPVITSFHGLVGDLTRVYGLANLNALSNKRQRTLPSGCNMYNLLNFVSEVATHHVKPAGQNSLQTLIGEMVASKDGFDLEGTIDSFGDWKDLLVQDADAIETMAVVRS